MSSGPDPRLRDFLRKKELVKSGEEPRWTVLAGGVSSDIWRVDLPGRSLCIKRALPTLKVAEAWHAPVERNAYEWAWIGFAAKHCPDAVPSPIASDPEQGVFAMSFLDPEHYPVWKSLLVGGIVDSEVATQVGAIIARLHGASAGDPEIAERFRTDAIFHAIRLEPYLLATAARHRDLEGSLHGLAKRTAETRVALVHGDVSPKNILLGPKGPVLIDAECAWYGDPAFDAAFCLNHFLLKCVARPQSSNAFLDCFASFAKAYIDGAKWEPSSEIESRIATLLPGLFLARIDGKSPVEYITDDRDKELVRAAARDMLVRPPDRLAEVSARWRNALAINRYLRSGP
jgi:aminoglycoside phosphotransferase (APT) family kinase protein